MGIAGTFLTISVYTISGVVAEVASWLLIYRTEWFRKLQDDLDKADKKLKDVKSSGAEKSNKQKQKKEQKYEEQIKLCNRMLTSARWRSYIIVG